ncbi:phosphoribosyltransferase [Consotaella salsifontis]|uniref:Putative phosphoribosyl transferase n=1 Tax=Consotaella salsifontis TaxID=1365950 RepID=A0A1T4RZ24_9HYPH|nr:phosphoribosyltransferase family protein [Consotaella salsifontis]SKA21260.1 putative phosphoribosyl transferase [Consotaella salsifontis]
MTIPEKPFADRRDAGQMLAEVLVPLAASRPVVLALPRGGVPVAFEVASALKAPLDVLLVRKIGAPGEPELGLGAVVEGEPAEIVLNDEVTTFVEASPAYVEAEARRQVAEIEHRRALYGRDRVRPDLKGRTVILMDDGIATGGTARAALTALARSGASRLILAVPVAPSSALAGLSEAASEIFCLRQPEDFRSVGEAYVDFDQTSDEEVIALLDQARSLGDPK